MPPERHSPPPARPPRDRPPFGGPGAGGPRRPFTPGGGPGGGGPRRPFTPGGGFGGGQGGGPRPPFRPAQPAAPPLNSVRLRDGDREAEVSGSPEFVRQALDDLPELFARLRGEAPNPARPASISMPPPPRPHAGADHDAFDLAGQDGEEELDDEPEEFEDPEERAQPRDTEERPQRRGRHRKPQTLEEQVFAVLARAEHPMSVAAIRQRLGGEASGQQIRRLLERASDRVIATDERPAGYALR